MSRLLLVDGNSIMNRAYYAVIGRAPMTAPDGTPTGAVNGFFNSVLGVMKEYNPDHMCVLFDRREPTFRHKMSTEYKANRKGMPDDLAAQMPVVKNLLDLYGICRMELAGYEADDLIGTLSKQGEEKGMEVYIFSGDHDDFQLISDKVSVIMPQSGKGKEPRVLYDRALFEETYGVKPEVFVQVKALMGDNSDNIKGVEKVGEKTAFKLIADYGSCDNVIANADKLSPALSERVKASVDLLALNIKLCTIDRESPVEYTADDAVYPSSTRDLPAMSGALNRLALKSLLKKLDLENVKPAGFEAPVEVDESISAVSSEVETVLKNGLAVKYEVPSSVDFDSLNCGVDFVDIPSGNKVVLLDWNSKTAYVLSPEEFNSLTEGKKVLPVSYQYKDRSKLIKEPLKSVDSVFDVEIAGYVLNILSGKPDLQRLYESVMLSAYPVEDKRGPAKQLSLFEEIVEDDGSSKVQECAEKLLVDVAIAKVLSDTIEKDNDLKNLLYDIEFPLVITLDKIERNGMHVSGERLAELHSEYTKRLEDISAHIYDECGTEFNISSPKQLADVLYGEKYLNLPSGKKGKSGDFSTGIDELNRLRHYSPAIDYIIKYREISKLDSTYASGLARSIKSDSRIHTTFTQAMTNTGRLSSTEPNLQNIPVRTEEGSRLREAFTAEEGKILVDADYSQIELRLLAALSGDEIMCSAFREGEDIHKRTAAKVFGVSEEMVTHKMRATAKTVNFSIIYGISEYGLATDLGIGYKEAAELIKEYNNQFPGITSYLDSLKKSGEEKGYAVTMYGRKRILNELKSQNRNIKNFGYRAAMNTPIQGTAADIIKIAMNRVSKALEERLPSAKLVMQVHDELICECNIEDKDLCAEILKSEMEAAAKLSVPLLAEVGFGKDWLEAK
ncbi:DNA polymerase I [Ruminococcaceae bacterium YAD3003]|nr:DNA polymerase I [Ruminococcaceae bacterium YAD3003]